MKKYQECILMGFLEMDSFSVESSQWKANTFGIYKMQRYILNYRSMGSKKHYHPTKHTEQAIQPNSACKMLFKQTC